MDEFGFLTEKYGLKPQGKSAPMAASKRQQQSAKVSNSVNGCRVNDGNLDFGTVAKQSNDGFDGNFGGSSFDLESVLGEGLTKGNIGDDIFGGMTGLNSSRNDEFSGVSEMKERGLVADLVGGFGGSRDGKDEGEVKSSREDVKPVGDLLGDFDGPHERLEGMDGKDEGEVKRSGEDGGLVDDLLVDFGGSCKKWDEADGDEKEDVEESRADANNGGVVGDLLGGFGGSEENFKGMDSKGKGDMEKSGDGVDDLIPGFGGSDNNNDRANVETGQPQRSTFHSHLSAATSADPFIVFESGSTPGNNAFTDHLDQLGELTSSGGTRPGGLRSRPSSDKARDSEPSLLDDLEDCRGVNNTNNYANFDSSEGKEGDSPRASRFREAEDVGYDNLPKGDGLESIFDMNYQSSSVPKSKATYPDPMFNADVFSEGGPVAAQKTPSGASTNAEKASSYTNFDHLSSIFGAATLCEEFEEIEGESEERRKARLARFERTKAREARALAEMNQRDCQRQLEQEERCRVAEIMDSEIKHWAMGKEGNVRALLSSLQDVLWSECGWEPVSLTDLIMSASVKKVYYKATLCVHPDKVQQKGANLEQKYIAEKVFDILKEAYNKFNKEELS